MPHPARTTARSRPARHLDELTDPDDPDPMPVDLDTVIVVNDWTVVRFGHRTLAERELAEAIAERNRTRRRMHIAVERAA